MDEQEIGRLIADVFPGGELTETHISWVICSDRYAYKIKKPVCFSFLDFSTLKKRRYFCLREVRLNRRLAGDMYIDVVPIFQKDQQYSLKQGNIVEYAVRMKRMDTTLEMDHLLVAGKVSEANIDKLAVKIADFHASAPLVKRAVSPAVVRTRFNELLDLQNDVIRHLGKNYAADIPAFVQQSDHYLDRHKNYFDARAKAGYVRKLHGDLHCGNILLYDDPVIFDCIEFDDGLRNIDILDEVAFLTMDLEAFGRQDLSDCFYARYHSEMAIPEDNEGLLFYQYCKFYRANVRAKVQLIRLGISSSGHSAAKLQVMRYFDLMRTYISNTDNRFTDKDHPKK